MRGAWSALFAMKQTRHCHWIPQPRAEGNPVVPWTKTTSGPIRPETGRPEHVVQKVNDFEALRVRYNKLPMQHAPFVPITAPVFTEPPKQDVSECCDATLRASNLAARVYASLNRKRRKKVEVIEYD
jgi:hypothetical protein